MSSLPPNAMITAVIPTIVATGIRNAMWISSRGRALMSPRRSSGRNAPRNAAVMLGRGRAVVAGAAWAADLRRLGALGGARRGFGVGRIEVRGVVDDALRGAVVAARFGACGALGAGHGASRSGWVSSHRSANRSGPTTRARVRESRGEAPVDPPGKRPAIAR